MCSCNEIAIAADWLVSVYLFLVVEVINVGLALTSSHYLFLSLFLCLFNKFGLLCLSHTCRMRRNIRFPSGSSFQRAFLLTIQSLSLSRLCLRFISSCTCVRICSHHNFIAMCGSVWHRRIRVSDGQRLCGCTIVSNVEFIIFAMKRIANVFVLVVRLFEHTKYAERKQ